MTRINNYSKLNNLHFNLKSAPIEAEWIKYRSRKIFLQLRYLISWQFFKQTYADLVYCQTLHSRPLELQSPGLLKQFMDVSFVPLQLSSLCKSFFSRLLRSFTANRVLIPSFAFRLCHCHWCHSQLFMLPIVKLILCQRPLGILPSTPHAQQQAIRFHRRRWLLCPWMAW